MPKSIQTNKEFVEAAGIAGQDAFIAVAIRCIVARMTEIPANELTAEMAYADVMRRSGAYTDWDALQFAILLEEQCGIVLEPDQFWKNENRKYGNWFYNPDEYRQFDFVRNWFWKPDPSKKIKTTFGGWVITAIEMIHATSNDSISPPSDWPGLESSDLGSDAVVSKSPMHDGLRRLHWGCFGLLAIGAVVLLVSKIIVKG